MWSVLSSRGGPAPTLTGAASAAVVASVTSIPADVYDTVGSGGLADPLRATTFEMLRGPSGLPLVIYVGAEYCPFCASEKWSVIAALSRFGTFQGLELSTSSSTDAFPDTPTLTFRTASYQSTFIELSAIETADRQGRPMANTTPVQQAAMDRSDPQSSIPFVSIAERHVAVGSGYRPDVLVGKTWTQIAEAMRDPSTPLARGVIGNANWITAAICEQTGGQPASVCASPAVRSLAVR
ncbi:MAG: DUF929 family protein [Actinobacteria bacterium]|nr:DUF929 family protein [Actinomycetota bacterium]